MTENRVTYSAGGDDNEPTPAPMSAQRLMWEPLSKERVAEIEPNWRAVAERDGTANYIAQFAMELLTTILDREREMRRLGAELSSLEVRHKDLGRYAVHLGNCKFMEDPDVCTCGLAAHSEVLPE